MTRLGLRPIPALCLACLACLLLAAAQAPAQDKPQAQPQAAAQAAPKPAPHPDAQARFTIKAIEPRADKEELVLAFSRFVPLEALREQLRLSPRVRIHWDKSRSEQNGQVTLKADFRYGARYLVSLPEDFKVGGATYAQGVFSFFMPDRKAAVSFLDARRVVELNSRQMVHLRARNVEALTLETLTLPAALAPVAEAAQADPKAAAVARERIEALSAQLAPLAESQSWLTPFFTKPDTEKRLFAVRGEKNKDRPFSVPLSLRKNAAAGAVILAKAADAKEGGAAAPPLKVLAVTDLGLTYKRGRDQMLFWVTSLRDATPKPKAKLAALTKLGEVFDLGEAGSDGVLVFTAKTCKGVNLGLTGQPAPVERRLEPGEITHILAATKDDVTFMRLLARGNSAPMGVRQFEPGEPIPGLSGMVFTERGVYRPGETVHFKGVVRQFKDNQVVSPAGRKCVFTVTGPRGETVHELTLDASDFGTASADFALGAHLARGEYTLAMRYAPKKEKKKNQDQEDEYGREKPEENVAKCVFQVQEFRAPRHFAELAFTRAQKKVPGAAGREESIEIVRIAVTGSYYAGGQVKGGLVRWKIYGADTNYAVPGLDDYSFGYKNGEEDRPVLIESGQDTLNDQGQAVIEFPLDRSVLSGKSGLSVSASVVDFDGRAASTTKLFQVEPEVFVGVSRHPKELPQSALLDLSALAADAKGARAKDAKFEVRIFEREYVSTAKRNEKGDVVTTSEPVWRKARSKALETEDGLARYRLDMSGYNTYLVVFAATVKDKTYLSSTVCEGRFSEYESSWEARKLPFTPLTLVADSEQYQPGQTARVTFKSSRPLTTYLATFERDGVFEYRVVAPKSDAETVSLPVKPEYAPNVYVSVIGLTPRGEFPAMSFRYDAEAPGYALGSVDLPVRKSYQALSVAIAPDKQELSGTPGQTVSLDIFAKDAGGKPVDAEMAVAVVMESVLALTAYKTPELSGLTRFDLPLGVFTGELRSLLVHQTPFYLARNEPLTGGDGGAAMDAITKLRRRFSPVAYYNPKLRTGSEGKAQISFTLPDSLTAYRVYAVACDKGSAFASAERKLVATKNFYLEPGLPDFFTKGDTFAFKVAAFNTTAAPGEAAMKIEDGAGLELTTPGAPTAVPAKSSAEITVTGKALTPGQTAIKFSGAMGESQDAVEAKVRINSGLLSQTLAATGQIMGAGAVKAPQPPVKLTPEQAGEALATITLSGSPYLRISQAMRQMLAYPYGCVEQTASGAIAASALLEAAKAGLTPEVDAAKLADYLDKNLSRLASMQLAGGGFGYWPGAGVPTPLGSLYASLAMAMAEKAKPGAYAPALKLAQDYLADLIRNQNRPAVYKAFAAYVLALSGAPDRGAFAELERNYAKQSRETKLWMILTASQAKILPPAELKTRLAAALSDAAATGKEAADDEFRAVYRAPAIALLAANAIAPRGPEEARAMQALLGGLSGEGGWTSTSDTGMAVAAMAGALKGVSFPTEPVNVAVSQPGGKAQTVTVDPKTATAVALDAAALIANPLVSIDAPAGTSLLYRVTLNAPRPDIDASGETKGVRVEKTIANVDGTDQVKVGDMVKVTVTVDVPGAPLRYLAVNDPLPAGLMAINAAFKTEEPMPGGGGDETSDESDDFNYFTSDGAFRARASHFEIRDDRALIFQDRTYTGPHVYEYYARAVCQGDFAVPATKAEAMYQPGVHGYSKAGRLVVGARQ